MSTEKKSGFCFAHEVKESPGKGLGVFAAEDIPQGSIVWRHVPGLYTVHDEPSFKRALETMSHDEAVYELTHVFGLKDLPECLIRVHDDGVLMNHSDEANLVTNNAGTAEKALDATSPHYLRDASEALLGERYALVATRDIKAGEEFTNDYVAEEGVSEPAFYDALCEQYGVDEAYLEGG